MLTNVGLEHTRWLGPTIADIAAEKLDVVPPGRRRSSSAPTCTRTRCARRARCAPSAGRELVVAPAPTAGSSCSPRAPSSGATSPSRAPRPRPTSAPLDDAAVARGGRRDARARPLPGRRRGAGDDHRRRPQRRRAWRRWPTSLRGVRRRAAGSSRSSRSSTTRTRRAMLRELLPLCAEVVFTQSANPRALPPGTLESLAGQLGGPPARTDRRARAARCAVAREAGRPGRRRARHRLDLPHRRPAAPGGRAAGGRCCERRRPLDARDDRRWWRIIVAVVILVFFALGYLFGRLFL